MKKVPFQVSAPILKYFELSEEVNSSIDPQSTPEAVVTQLQAFNANLDLANFWAHALPMRESIWWAVLAVQQRKDVWSGQELAVLENAKAWVRNPSETLRRQLEQQADMLDNKSAVKWLGMAVFWSGTGSIAAPGDPAVMPAEFLYAKAVGGAVNTAAALPEWQGTENYYRSAFASAKDIAEGGTGELIGKH